MKTIILLCIIVSIAMTGCGDIFPHSFEILEWTHFDNKFRGAIELSSWGDWMEISLDQAIHGSRDGWVVQGTGKSYLLSNPQYQVEFMVMGYVSFDDPTKARLHLDKYAESKEKKLFAYYVIEATSDSKVFDFRLLDPDGKVQTNGILQAY